MNNLKIGDVVRLKSGGPLMTIQATEIISLPDSVSCIWFDDKNAHQVQVFKPATLALVDLDED